MIALWGRVALLLFHGTTQQRAESIIASGPDGNYCEPNGEPAEGFFVVPDQALSHPDVVRPEEYARFKADIPDFQSEGGPALVVIELPDEQAAQIVGEPGELLEGKALHNGIEIQFDDDGGLTELCAFWPDLHKGLILLLEP